MDFSEANPHFGPADKAKPIAAKRFQQAEQQCEITTSLASLAKALGGDISGDQVLAPGPGHSREDRSLCVKLDQDAPGGFVVHSFAGDDVIVCRDFVRQRLGAEPFRPKRESQFNIVNKYPYADENGQLLFQVCRLEPKSFRQRKPKESGGWSWSVKGVRQVVYRLPEIKAAIEAGTPIVVVEGEKDADALAAIGIPATCNAGGAGKWRKAHSDCLSGGDVVILPDNDAPGREHADAVAASLQGVATRVRVLPLPDLPEKGDVSDWLAAGGDAERLAELVESKARDWQQQGEAVATQAVDGQTIGPIQRGSRPACYGSLIMTESETPVPRDILANGSMVLRTEMAFAGRIRFDEHRSAIVRHDVPWDRGGEPGEWTDTDDVRLAEYMQMRDVLLRPSTCANAVSAVADDHRFHPIREYLDSICWDGLPRIDTWLTGYLGVEDTPYARAVGRCWLISGVARIRQPGCKADYILILEGDQGIRKSGALETLMPVRSWFADELGPIGNKDASQALRGKWLIEIAELSALKRSEVETVKAFASRAVDHYRPSYGRRAQDFPRQCIFGGTTNAEAYLADETGNRRFWPVLCTRADLAAIERDRSQLWAEADHAYRNGAMWWLTEEQESAAADEQADRMVDDPWHELVTQWASQRTQVSVPAVLEQCLDIPLHRRDPAAQKRVAQILRVSGYRRRRTGPRHDRRYVYERRTGTQKELP